MPFTTILVPLDFSDVTPSVVEHATSLATLARARIILLHVSAPEPDFVGFDAGPQTVRASVAKDIRTEHHRLEEYKQSCMSAGLDCLALHIQGTISEKILVEAAAQQADLIVVGSHGHGALYHLFTGSVTGAVLHGARCPVLVVPVPRPELPPQ